MKIKMLIECVYIFASAERRSPKPRLLTLPERAALFLASLQKPLEGMSIVTSFSGRTESSGYFWNFVSRTVKLPLFIWIFKNNSQLSLPWKFTQYLF